MYGISVAGTKQQLKSNGSQEHQLSGSATTGIRTGPKTPREAHRKCTLREATSDTTPEFVENMQNSSEK